MGARNIPPAVKIFARFRGKNRPAPQLCAPRVSPLFLCFLL